LDERGKNFSSPELAETIDNRQGQGDIIFLIGPAEGFIPIIRERADLCISFGKATWPHMLLRVMLVEQIYRSLQILSGHPYHK
jgi:23S rRNA (pseudouridine1915-N3)-methyltransferase